MLKFISQTNQNPITDWCSVIVINKTVEGKVLVQIIEYDQLIFMKNWDWRIKSR